MKSGIIVVSEYSKGRTFEEAVDILFREGLMNGSYKVFEDISREQARRCFHSWYNEVIGEAEVMYIVGETYDEEHEQWLIDYTEGVEILPCRM